VKVQQQQLFFLSPLWSVKKNFLTYVDLGHFFFPHLCGAPTFFCKQEGAKSTPFFFSFGFVELGRSMGDKGLTRFKVFFSSLAFSPFSPM
jgi:hypothetical protein